MGFVLKKRKEIILAKNIGFCFGVERAYQMSIEALEKAEKPCQMLGYLVHNEAVTEELQNKGLGFISSPDQANSGTVIIRSHGVGDEIISRLQEKGLKIIDTTCPFVRREQDFARSMDENGRQVIIIGEKGHAEVDAVNGSIGERGIIINGIGEIELIPKDRPLGIVIQTTQDIETVDNILEKLKGSFENVKVCNTLCRSVMDRQKEAKQLAEEADLVLVIGSKKSANTQRLVTILQNKKKYVFGVENSSDVKKEWFNGVNKIGIISGTSAPPGTIEEVVEKIKELCQ